MEVSRCLFREKGTRLVCMDMSIYVLFAKDMGPSSWETTISTDEDACMTAQQSSHKEGVGKGYHKHPHTNVVGKVKGSSTLFSAGQLLH